MPPRTHQQLRVKCAASALCCVSSPAVRLCLASRRTLQRCWRPLSQLAFRRCGAGARSPGRPLVHRGRSSRRRLPLRHHASSEHRPSRVRQAAPSNRNRSCVVGAERSGAARRGGRRRAAAAVCDAAGSRGEVGERGTDQQQWLREEGGIQRAAAEQHRARLSELPVCVAALVPPAVGYQRHCASRRSHAAGSGGWLMIDATAVYRSSAQLRNRSSGQGWGGRAVRLKAVRPRRGRTCGAGVLRPGRKQGGGRR